MASVKRIKLEVDEDCPSSPNTDKSVEKSTPKRRKSEKKEIVQRKEPSVFTTEPTIDELIFPDATFQSYAEFEEKFNRWKAKYQHPFRVASSETLRTETGATSEKFRYRYVVFHCARYGNPRMRGEGKRPNQNYLPCACTAALRLNFQYSDQCLRLTTLETRHSNHELCPKLYESLLIRENAKKKQTKLRSVDNSSESSSSPDLVIDNEETAEKKVETDKEEGSEELKTITDNAIVTEFYQRAPVAQDFPLAMIPHPMPHQVQPHWPSPFHPIVHPIPIHPFHGHQLQNLENQPPTLTDLEKPVELNHEVEEVLAKARRMLGACASREVFDARMTNLSSLLKYWEK